jgi:3-hydroxymyristoyl/3-hydroxydecanoyl-(acyl carrier protein) dehydratase
VALEPLPHVYPFRFVDRTVTATGRGSGIVRAVVTANQKIPPQALPGTLCEMLAQAVLLIEGGDADLGRTGFLAGISDFWVDRLPEPGDILTIDVKLAGRLGPTVKFEGVILDEAGEKVASGALTVRKGTHPPA